MCNELLLHWKLNFTKIQEFYYLFKIVDYLARWIIQSFSFVIRCVTEYNIGLRPRYHHWAVYVPGFQRRTRLPGVGVGTEEGGSRLAIKNFSTDAREIN